MFPTSHGGRLGVILVVVIAVLWTPASAGASALFTAPTAQESWPPVPTLVEDLSLIHISEPTRPY